MKSMKIVPIIDNKPTALSVRNSPDATGFIGNYNRDLEFENDKVLQMDDEIQKYTSAEDDMITDGLGLIAGMKMEGAVLFKEFKTVFSTTQFL
ncbi:hypothetical protein TL16_g08517 [Triparma laevis f. inornata]|uniref:Uncharacterized protein n=1 Tax=Triparma laevis f. inornata TaxID=1714386 RepID=A0A9W7AY02_9STRA|nr:hypothetical protein TL16_g08517 [Triparma laevis f. inornata]